MLVEINLIRKKIYVYLSNGRIIFSTDELGIWNQPAFIFHFSSITYRGDSNGMTVGNDFTMKERRGVFRGNALHTEDNDYGGSHTRIFIVR